MALVSRAGVVAGILALGMQTATAEDCTNLKALMSFVDQSDIGSIEPVEQIWQGIGFGENRCDYVRFGKDGRDVEIHCHWWNSDTKTHTATDVMNMLGKVKARCDSGFEFGSEALTNASLKYRDAYYGDYAVMTSYVDDAGMHAEIWFDWEMAAWDFLPY